MITTIFSTIGGLTMVMGIVTALEAVPEYGGLTWMFWLILSGVLLLIGIAAAVGKSDYE